MRTHPMYTVCLTSFYARSYFYAYHSRGQTDTQYVSLVAGAIDKSLDKVFGKNYLVRLRPFGRSCRAAMEPTMNKQFARRAYSIHGETNINNNDSSSINNINNISIITYRHYCDRLFFFSFISINSLLQSPMSMSQSFAAPLSLECLYN